MTSWRKFAAFGAVSSMLFAVLIALGLATASTASAYPVTVCATISVSATNPPVGTTITVTGASFTPAKVLTLILEGSPDTIGHHVLGTVTVSSTGTFTFNFTLSAPIPQHVLVAVGDDLSTNCPSDPFAEIAFAAAGSGGGGTPASTGFNVEAGLVIGAVLIGAGSIAIGSGRRRRSHRSSAGA